MIDPVMMQIGDLHTAGVICDCLTTLSMGDMLCNHGQENFTFFPR